MLFVEKGEKFWGKPWTESRSSRRHTVKAEQGCVSNMNMFSCLALSTEKCPVLEADNKLVVRLIVFDQCVFDSTPDFYQS